MKLVFSCVFSGLWLVEFCAPLEGLLLLLLLLLLLVLALGAAVGVVAVDALDAWGVVTGVFAICGAGVGT